MLIRTLPTIEELISPILIGNRHKELDLPDIALQELARL